jgi:hypothetical protein
VAREMHGGCMCNLCQKLKDREDSRIMTLGTFYYRTGLRKRDKKKKKKKGQVIRREKCNTLIISPAIFVLLIVVLFLYPNY